MIEKRRLVIIEDDKKFLEGVRLLLENLPSIELLGTYTAGQKAIKGIIENRPDIALIDIGLPDISGVEVIEKISEQGFKTEFIVLTIYDDDEHLFLALKAGAVGYIVKNEAALPELLQAIEEVSNGGAPMSFGIARRILNEIRKNRTKKRDPLLENLTKREIEILEYLAKGFNAKKVADKLYISYETVRSHQKNIYRKLQVNSLPEAISIFYKGDKLID